MVRISFPDSLLVILAVASLHREHDLNQQEEDISMSFFLKACVLSKQLLRALPVLAFKRDFITLRLED